MSRLLGKNGTTEKMLYRKTRSYVERVSDLHYNWNMEDIQNQSTVGAPQVVAKNMNQQKPATLAEVKTSTKKEVAPAVSAKKTVLVVEDDVFLSSLLVTRLQKSGLDVIKAMTGEEALEILKGGKKPDLVLLDIILPQKSGFEVLEEIQSDPSLQKAPVIITSNLGQDSDIKRGKELGVIDYFVKAQTPIDDLVSKIKQAVGQ